MKLIDRYVYAVTERLPVQSREELSKELKANIEDMLPKNPTDTDIRKVLEQLGNPVSLADQYNDSKRYLIGPSAYESYISVLKLVIGIVISVLVGITVFEKILAFSADMSILTLFIEILVSVIVGSIQGFTQAFLWVTIIFFILDRTGVTKGEYPFMKKEWSIDDLPTLPITDKNKISRGQTIFSMFCTMLFTVLILTKADIFGWYQNGDNGLVLLEPFFEVNRLKTYLFFIFCLAIFEFCIFIYKLVSNRWTIPLAITNTINNIANSILVIVMVNDNALFNQKFISLLPSEVTPMIHTSIVISVAVFVGITVWDSAEGFIKSRK